MSENGVIYTADKNFTLPLAVTAVTNSTSDWYNCTCALGFLDLVQNSPFTLSPFEDDPKKNKMISALTVLREMNWLMEQ